MLAAVDRNQQRTTELVAMTTAAAYVYRELMGKAIEPMTVAEGNAILHDVARAVSKVAAIYGAIHERETPKPLPLIGGAFHRGATVFRTSDGIEYRRLAVRRAELRLVIEVLKHAGARFERAATE